MLAIYLAIKHFRHMFEARTFVIYTDHKPLILDKNQRNFTSIVRSRHLDFISQFTTDIRYVSDDKNVVADALSRNEELQFPMDYFALTAS